MTRTAALLLALVCAPLFVANAQQTDAPEGALIESAEVSGLAFDRLSPGLRQAIEALAGQPLNREQLAELAVRIEQEHPDAVAAVRSVPRPGGEVRVVFLVARIGDEPDLVSNINARYIVERVDIEGIDDDKISQPLRDDLQGLVGGRLDPDEAERLDDRLAAELPGYHVSRRISRGSAPGQIRLVFDISIDDSARMIRFASSRSKVIYHSHQGWSGVLDVPLGGPRDHRVTLGLAFGNNDDLIEEYSGYRLRLESRKLAADRLGASLEVSRFRQTWRQQTLSALTSDSRIPGAYRTRLVVEPLVTFAFNPRARVTAGVSVSELESLARSPESRMANAVVASMDYDQRWEQASGSRQTVAAAYAFRSAATALESDLVYKRHFAQARYEYRQGNSTVMTAVLLGRLTGRAPLFERFSLGDSSTLRGWNKYDVAPAGGDRMFHHSLEYRYRYLALFVDTGSVWEPNADRRLRFATGAGFHGEGAFLTLGFPLNSDEAGAMLMLGVRF